MSINKNFTRKEFLQASSALVAGLTIPGNSLEAISFKDIFSSRKSENEELSIPSPIKTVIFINMEGGMSHVDTLDPKRGSAFGQVDSSIPSLRILEPFKKTASHLHKLSVIRTTYCEDGDHGMAQHLLNTGYRETETVGIPDLPHMGSMISYVKSLNQPKSSYFPRYVTMGGRNGKIGDPGYLSVDHAGFHIGDPNKPLSNITPSWGKYEKDRISRRESFLELLNQDYKKVNRSSNLELWDKMYVAAREFRDSNKISAFDWSKEPESILKKYGESWQSKSFLMARKLAEIEVPFIQISIGGWDTHDNNKSRITKIMSETDQGLAALLDDLEVKGLFGQTLFLLSSEFGRTPDVGARDGRDHHPKVWTSLIGGGKISRGRVFGTTDEKAEKPEKNSQILHVRDLIASLYSYAGVNPAKQIMNSQNRPVAIANKASKVMEI
jgi:hypothetical protein